MKARTNPAFMVALLVAATLMLGSFGTALADDSGGQNNSGDPAAAGQVVAGVLETQSAAQISVGEVSAAPGATATLNVSIANNPGILGATLKVDFDEGLTLIEATQGEALSGLSMTIPGKFVSGCRFPWDGTDLAAEDVKDGTLLSLTFQVPENAGNGAKYGVYVTCQDPIDANLNAVDVTVENGAINVLSYIAGDANGDNAVTSTDNIFIRRWVAGGYNISINEQAADVNGDNKVSMTDVIIIRRYLAGGYGINQLPISSSEHTHSLVHTESKDATCTEPGNAEYWMCKTCGKYYTDANGINEVTKADTVIAAKGHTIVIDEAVAPTATESGLTEGSHCSVCGEVITKQEVVPPTGGGNTYSITYNLYGNDTYLQQVGVQNDNPTYYTAGVELSLIEPQVEGYVFEGWYDGAGSQANRITSIPASKTGNVTLYAHWSLFEYEIQFDSPLVPQASIKYTVNRGATIPAKELFGYSFLGWTDENDGNTVTKVPKGTAKDITLVANWTSRRNLTRPVKRLDEPTIIEDKENGKYLFVYKIGQIENVPLYPMKTFLNSAGIEFIESVTVTNSIGDQSSESVVKTISNTTTKTNTWGLSKNWNDSLTLTETHYDETGVESSTTTRQATENDFVKVGSKEQGGTKGKVVSTQDGQSASMSASGKVTGPGYEVGVEAGFELSHTDGTEKSKTATWNTSEGFQESHKSSSDKSVSSSVSSKFGNEYGYNKTHSEGGEETLENSTSVATSSSDEMGSTLVHSTEEITTTSKTYSNSGAPEGNYRLVCAANVGVYAVVGYDISTKSFFVYSFGIQDKNTYDFVDYSKTTTSFDDEENGVLPFEVPAEVRDLVADWERESIGLEIDKATGLITNYDGAATDVYVPNYIIGDDVSDHPDVIQVKGIQAGAFKNNTSIKSVRFGKYVTEITDSAFRGCTSLESVTAPSVAKIGNNAFAGCTSLTSVSDDLVTEIGDSAFNGCTALNGYSVTSSVTSIGVNAFKDVKMIDVDASSADIVRAACAAGAKRISLYTGDVADQLANSALAIPESVEYFEWNGEGKTYAGIQLLSKAAKTVINKVNVVSTSAVPLKLESDEVAIGETSVESPTWALVLPKDSTDLTIESGVMLKSTGQGAMLSKNVRLKRNSTLTTAKLSLTGDMYVCPMYVAYTDGSDVGDNGIGDPDSVLEFTSSTYRIVNISESDFDALLNGTLDWVLASEMPAGATVVDQKWTYDKTTTATSSSSTMPGYTLYNTTWAWGSYGAWSGWQNSSVSSSDSRQVETRTIAATYETQYNYSRWAQYSNNTGQLGPVKGTWSGIYCQYYFERGWSTTKLAVSSTQYSNQVGGNFNLYGNNQWFNESTRQVVKTAAYTQYRYRDRSKVYTYHFKKVENLESATEVTAADGISNIQKWVKYVIA